MNILGHLDLLLALAAPEQRRIDLRQNLIKRKRYFGMVQIRLSRKYIGNHRAQFTVGHRHHSAAKLDEHLIQ